MSHYDGMVENEKINAQPCARCKQPGILHTDKGEARLPSTHNYAEFFVMAENPDQCPMLAEAKRHLELWGSYTDGACATSVHVDAEDAAREWRERFGAKEILAKS